MDSCPRYLAIAVEDYEGPFSDAQTIGIAEVDFLKYTTEGLNEIWVYLEGEKVRGTGARLHLKIALNNENASEAGTRTKELAEIVEQETGKKVRVWTSFRSLESMYNMFLVKDRGLRKSLSNIAKVQKSSRPSTNVGVEHGLPVPTIGKALQLFVFRGSCSSCFLKSMHCTTAQP